MIRLKNSEPGAGELEPGPPPPGRGGEQPDHRAVEEPAHPVRGVEEVQRRPGRRGVDDDQVPLLAGPQLPQLLHRHVLLRAREGRRQRLVEGVGEDLLGPLRRGVRDDDVVERPLHVQHHRVQLAVGPGDVDPAAARCPARPGPGTAPAGGPGRWSGRRPCRPASAAASASAADVVVLPTPPEPQQTMIRVSGSAISAARSMRAGAGPAVAAGPRSRGRGHHAATWLRRCSSRRSASSNRQPTSIGPVEQRQLDRRAAERLDVVPECVLGGPAPGVLDRPRRPARRRSARRRAGARPR